MLYLVTAPKLYFSLWEHSQGYFHIFLVKQGHLRAIKHFKGKTSKSIKYGENIFIHCLLKATCEVGLNGSWGLLLWLSSWCFKGRCRVRHLFRTIWVWTSTHLFICFICVVALRRFGGWGVGTAERRSWELEASRNTEGYVWKFWKDVCISFWLNGLQAKWPTIKVFSQGGKSCWWPTTISRTAAWYKQV